MFGTPQSIVCVCSLFTAQYNTSSFQNRKPHMAGAQLPAHKRLCST